MTRSDFSIGSLKGRHMLSSTLVPRCIIGVRLGLGSDLVADHSIGEHPGEGWGSIGSNNGLPTFATVIRARHIAILAEYHKGHDLAEMFTVRGTIPSPLPLKGCSVNQ